MEELGDDWCAVDAYLDQAPDDVKTKIETIYCLNGIWGVLERPTMKMRDVGS